MAMNFMIYALGVLDFWICGFAFMFGGGLNIGAPGREYFDDKKDVLSFDCSIFQTILSGDIKVGKLTIIPEFRIEKCFRKHFQKT